MAIYENMVRNAFCLYRLTDEKDKQCKKKLKMCLTYYLIQLNNEFMICDSEYKSKVVNQS